MTHATPFLMFDERLDEALDLYASVFPDFEVLHPASSGTAGPIRAAEFAIGRQRFQAYEGGPHFRFTEAFSILVTCEDQAEVDRIWERFLAAGATEVQCGWLRDPFGLSWQIVPKRFFELVADEDAARVRAVMAAMLSMRKLDVAALERAYETP